MSREFRNAEVKAMVPAAGAITHGLRVAGARRDAERKPRSTRKKKPPLAVPGSVFDVRMPRKKKPPLAVPGSVFDVRMPKRGRSGKRG